MMRRTVTDLVAATKRCRTAITPTIWSTAGCIIRMAIIAMITAHWTWSHRRYTALERSRSERKSRALARLPTQAGKVMEAAARNEGAEFDWQASQFDAAP